MSGAESKLEEDGDPSQGSPYLPDTVVWAKVGKIWWAGQVTADFPTELTSRLRKDPLAVVKFFNEDNFHVIKKDTEITEYQGERKVGFIWKGLNYFAAKGGKSDEELMNFKAGVLDAEKLTGGSETIFEDLEAAKAAEATPPPPPTPVGVHKELGSALKKAAEAGTDKDLNGKSNEDGIPNLDLPHTPVTMATPTPSSSKKNFTCDVCNWTSGTMGGLIMHRKIHSSARGVTRASITLPKSSPAKHAPPAAAATMATPTTAQAPTAVAAAATPLKKRGRPPSAAKAAAAAAVATVPSPAKAGISKGPSGRKRKSAVPEPAKEQTAKKEDILGDWGDEDGEGDDDNPPEEDEPIPPVIKKPRSEKETKAVFDSLLQSIKPSEGKPNVDEEEPLVVREPSPPPAKLAEKPSPEKEPEPVAVTVAPPEPPKTVEPEKKEPTAVTKPQPVKPTATLSTKDFSDAALEQLLEETKPPEVDLKPKVPPPTSKTRQSTKIEAEKKKAQPPPVTVTVPTKVQPAPAATKAQPAPAATKAQPAPAPTKVQPAPAPTKVQPAPAPTKVQPAPAPTKVQPAPAPTKVQPAPAPTKVQPAPAPMKIKGHGPPTKPKEATPVLATKSVPKPPPPSTQKIVKPATVTAPAPIPTAVKGKSTPVVVHVTDVTPSPAVGGPISFGDTLLGLNALPPAKPRHVIAKKSAPTASASAPPRRNSATPGGGPPAKLTKTMTDPPLILATKSLASATTTLKPTATIKPTPTPPVAEEEQPMIRQALQGTLKTSPSDKDRPEHVAEKVMHLLPVENADGTITYMLLQMEDGQELRVDSVNGSLPPNSGVDAIYVDQPASIQRILSNVIKPGTTQPQPSDSKVNAGKPLTSVADGQSRAQRQGQHKTTTGSSGQGQGQVTSMEEYSGNGEGGNDGTAPMEQTPVEFYNVGSDGSGFDFSQLDGDNQIFVMQEDGTLIDPAALGLDLQQLLPNQSARVE